MHKLTSLLLTALVALLSTSCLTRIITIAETSTPVRYPVAPQYVGVTPQYTTTTVKVPAKPATTTTIQVSALTSDISLYLDLQAVAAAFAQSRTTEEFEEILNSYEYMISNLDLNGDGYVDYLRVMETRNGHNYLYVIQAVLARNIYQDVATIVVENYGASPYVQIIGHPYIYGANYIIEPVFVRRPLIFDYYGRHYYTVWVSPYYYGHFPPHYHHCAPRHYGHYHSYVTTYIHSHKYCHEVHYVDHCHYPNYSKDTQQYHKNDYATAHPEGSFNSRNSAVTYHPEGSSNSRQVTNARQLQQAVSATTTTTTGSRQSASGSRTPSSATSSRTPATSTSTSSRTPAASTSTSTSSRTPSASSAKPSTTTTTSRVNRSTGAATTKTTTTTSTSRKVSASPASKSTTSRGASSTTTSSSSSSRSTTTSSSRSSSSQENTTRGTRR